MHFFLSFFFLFFAHLKSNMFCFWYAMSFLKAVKFRRKRLDIIRNCIFFDKKKDGTG